MKTNPFTVLGVPKNASRDALDAARDRLIAEGKETEAQEAYAAILARRQAKADRAKQRRRLRYGTTSAAITAVVIVAVLLLNIIVGVVADRFPVTLDLSSDKVYTLSEESIAVAQSVKEDLEIVVFYGEENLVNSTAGVTAGVPEFDTTMKEFYNVLKQYRSYSGNRISYSFIDPDQEPTKFAAYSVYEVATGSILFLSGTQSRTCTLEDLYAIDSSDYTGSYTFESHVEKTLASNIHILATGDEHVVQVLVGHDEDANVIDGLKSLYELNGYTFREYTITGSAAFDPDAEMMLIAAPQTDYSSDEIKRIQQWLYNDGDYGRHLMVFVSTTATCPHLQEFLRVEYKLNVTDEIIVESDYSRIQSYNPLYAMCDVPESDFVDKAASTGRVLTPNARRINTQLEEKSGDKALDTYGIDLTEYPESAQVITLEDLTGDSDSKAEKITTPDASQYPLSSMIAYVMESFNNETQEYTRSTVVVSGCPYMAYSNVITNGSYRNEELLLETVQSMTGAQDSLSISTKKLSEDTVNFNSAVQMVLGLVVFTAGLPVVLLIVGLVVFLRRKNL